MIFLVVDSGDINFKDSFRFCMGKFAKDRPSVMNLENNGDDKESKYNHIYLEIDDFLHHLCCR